MMSLGVAEMSSINRGTVSAGLDLRLVGPDGIIVPLRADLHFSSQDPYAVGMSLDTGAAEPVEWILGRDLLAEALHGRVGIGDVRAWPSTSHSGAKVLTIVLGPPGGCARFEASAAEIEAFLARTFELVTSGQETHCSDVDAELAELLSQT
jgi:Streptomyces sporulation and cell division protein, SsgA